MNRIYLAISSLLAFAQCTTTDANKESEPAPVAMEAKGPATIDTRTQHDLAAEIRLAERHSDEDERAFQFSALAESWQGQRFRWTTFYVSAFCPNEEGCHVVPFNRGGEDKDIVQGWSPQLKLSQEQWKQLSTQCATAEGQCRVTFEATLSKFRISTEELTRLTFADVSLVAVGDNVQLQPPGVGI